MSVFHSNDMKFLDVSSLSTQYHTQKESIYAVTNVDFSITSGESIGIAGESACGKSTLGLSLIRSIQNGDSEGKIIFNGIDLLSISDQEFDEKFRWKEISMIFQGAMNSLDPVFTINEQFLEILTQHHFSGNKEKLIEDSLESVNLSHDILSKYPHELSGGMKQRVIIAMALILSPKFVIADEPTTALDVLTQAQIINTLKKLKTKGMSFMFITHDLGVLSEISDKIGIMYGGNMVEFGSLDDVFSNPKHPYTQGLLKSIPTLNGQKPQSIEGVPPSLNMIPTKCQFVDRCPHAFEKCESIPPKFITETGYVRCWLYDEKE